MLIVQMNENDRLTNGFAKQSHENVEYRQKEAVRDGLVGEGQELSEEDESQINEYDDKDHVNDDVEEDMELLQVQTARGPAAAMRPRRQQSWRPFIHWERFLPCQSIKVLLAENDDSTRHLVSALLANCGYKVTTAANGLQAWKLLEDSTNHIDLVLTEVAMPCLSGFGLLNKIMSHKTHRNIPMIMMSSHASISIVFKCLSKGAVDFLVKPIRKNELQNLWQHVWRKCHNASGSGSESAIRTQKPTKSKNTIHYQFDNDCGSNDEDDNGSTIGMNAKDGRDNGSGTQRSCTSTRRVVEVESAKPLSPWDQLAHPPDGKCAQGNHSRPEVCGNSWVPAAATNNHEEQQNVELGMHTFVYDDAGMGKERAPRGPHLQFKDPSKQGSGSNGDEIEPKLDGRIIQKGQLELNREKPNAELRNPEDNIKGASTSNTNPQIGSVVSDIPSGLSSSKKNKATCESEEMPPLKQSLRGLRDIGGVTGGTTSNVQNVLKHSNFSAFSRYISVVSTANQVPTETGNVGSCSPLGNSSEAAKTESVQNLHSNSILQRSNGSSENYDMGSTTHNTIIKPSLIQGKGDAAMTKTIPTQSRGMNQHVQAQNYHNYHLHQDYVHSTHGQHQKLANHDDHNLNGSDHGSNDQNGRNITLNPRLTEMQSNNINVVAENRALDSDGAIGSTTVVGQNRFALRMAALNRFRQKRKERCFEKKVRYQSRKKLAEQRPRVRGQFVRRRAHENKTNNACC